MSYFYRLFGLTVAAGLECPELISIASTDAVDIRITLGHVPETIEHPQHATAWVQVGKGVFQFLIDGVARYRVENGSSIRVDPLPGASEGDVRLYLLGMAMAALLHQRHLLPLHVCAVALNGEAYAFCGASGAGKSTLAAAFHHAGLPLLCDDVGVAIPDADGKVLFYPGFPRIKLWRDALDHFGINSSPLVRDLSRGEKFHLILHNVFQEQPLPLRRLYSLERGDAGASPRIDPLTRHQAIALLLEHTYRVELVRPLGNVTEHLRQCGLVAKTVGAFQYVRPWRLDRLETSLSFLFDHMHSNANIPSRIADGLYPVSGNGNYATGELSGDR